MKQLFRKHTIALAVGAILIITFFSSFIGLIAPEKPVTKTVEIAIYSGADYSQEIYKNSKAQVQVTVSKYKNNKFEVVYTTTVEAGSLSQLPSANNAMVKAIEVNNFYEKQEILVAKYTISYESDGAVLSYNRYVLLPDGKGKKALAVTI
jgi:hypothetical protein